MVLNDDNFFHLPEKREIETFMANVRTKYRNDEELDQLEADMGENDSLSDWKDAVKAGFFNHREMVIGVFSDSFFNETHKSNKGYF